MPIQAIQFLASPAGGDLSASLLGHSITSLKLRYLATPDLPLVSLLEHLPCLRRLDASFTKITSLTLPSLPEDGFVTSLPNLEKLNLTAIPLKPGLTGDAAALVHFIVKFPSLRTLSIGAIGGQDAPTVMRDRDLVLFTRCLSGESDGELPQTRVPLENVSLVGNSRLGSDRYGREDTALQYFVRKIGRYCRVRPPLNTTHPLIVCCRTSTLRLSKGLRLTP